MFSVPSVAVFRHLVLLPHPLQPDPGATPPDEMGPGAGLHHEPDLGLVVITIITRAKVRLAALMTADLALTRPPSSSSHSVLSCSCCDLAAASRDTQASSHE